MCGLNSQYLVTTSQNAACNLAKCFFAKINSSSVKFFLMCFCIAGLPPLL